MVKVPAAYQATRGSVLDIDRDFYAGLTDPTARTRVESLVVPIRDGRA